MNAQQIFNLAREYGAEHPGITFDLASLLRYTLKVQEMERKAHPFGQASTDVPLPVYVVKKSEPVQEPDLFHCPKCGGPADNGHDRSIPPNPYFCTKCMGEPHTGVTLKPVLYENRRLTNEEVAAIVGKPNAEPYDQTSLELCEVCGWKTLIPGDCCLNCERINPCPNCASLEAQNTELDRKLKELDRKPMNEFDALRLITETVGLLQSAGPVEGLIGIIRAVERAHGIV